jgi:lysophospholipase L1-like esterase
MGKGLTPTKAWIYAGLLVAGGVGVAKIIQGGPLLGSKPVVKKGDRLLLIGDSLGVGLRYPMKALAQEAGVAFDNVTQEGANMGHFASESAAFKGRQLGRELRAKLQSFRPTLVLVSLGTNDEAISRYNRTANVVALQGPKFEALLRLLRASAPEVAWIVPPRNSFMSTGLRQLIRDRLGRGKYFDSEKYAIPKQPDQVHPTPKGYAGWAGLIWRWASTGVAPAANAPIAPNA